MSPEQSAENVRQFEQCPECLFEWDKGDEPWHDEGCPVTFTKAQPLVKERCPDRWVVDGRQCERPLGHDGTHGNGMVDWAYRPALIDGVARDD